MKKLLYILLLIPSLLSATTGPVYKHDNQIEQKEWEHVYQKIDSLNIENTVTSSATVINVTIGTITVSGVGTGYVLIYSSTVFDLNTSSATTQATYIPTNTSITFTPKRVTSRVKVSFTGCLAKTVAGAAYETWATVFRNGSAITITGGSTYGMCTSGFGSTNYGYVPCSGTFYDIPNTISSVTYTVYIKSDVAGQGAAWGLSTAGMTCAESFTVEEWSY